ncbi:MAG TPA: sigma-70 family RNA polymerase sigma factor [Pirellulales bacterium]|nr:sigma-70 family RNA polymerase sigma factor [Pirellulales bacterium]
MTTADQPAARRTTAIDRAMEWATRDRTTRAAAAPIDWERCLAEHEGWLRGVILARTGERHAVDEVWQEVSLAAIEQRARIADPEKAPAWLYRVAVLRSIRYRRQCARQRKRLAQLATESNGHTSAVDDPFQWLLSEERRQFVRAALLELTGRDAEILMLKYQERWTYRRIAALLGISESAVDARVFRARERLRQRLADYFSPDDTHRRTQT